MVAVRPSVPEDIPAQRELWQLAFGDSDAYLDNFYRTYYRPERVVVLEEDGAVRAMRPGLIPALWCRAAGPIGPPTCTLWPPTPTAGGGVWPAGCWPGRMTFSARWTSRR